MVFRSALAREGLIPARAASRPVYALRRAVPSGADAWVFTHGSEARRLHCFAAEATWRVSLCGRGLSIRRSRLPVHSYPFLFLRKNNRGRQHSHQRGRKRLIIVQGLVSEREKTTGENTRHQKGKGALLLPEGSKQGESTTSHPGEGPPET